MDAGGDPVAVSHGGDHVRTAHHVTSGPEPVLAGAAACIYLEAAALPGEAFSEIIA